ncbi:MAG: tRNA dihydrouridine(16) synthase DusC [Proteobacteria bacterium]|nr:tRNA dihydrouridine(16) synthase DusC [Pseudomonadota bacterium]
MSIALAPMEGVFDYHLREMFTGFGGIDLCIAEFVRVSQTVLPRKTFEKVSPELLHKGKTLSQIPVYIQLLGGDAELIAQNAAVAVEYGASGVDLNFGCPAKVVNRHFAGSRLLQFPDKVFQIVKAVRNSVHSSIPVTAKIRLGYKDSSLALENAHAVQAGGADMITIHGRTKLEGYKLPIHWDQIGAITKELEIPVFANGEIWSLEDFKKCKEQTGCQHFMLGRGIFAYPDLAREISCFQKQISFVPGKWTDILEKVVTYMETLADNYQEIYVYCRTKQWIRLLGRQYPEGKILFARIKRTDQLATMERIIRSDLHESASA